jgi:HK97 family phage portal protein
MGQRTERFKSWISEKLNPAQPMIASGKESSTAPTFKFKKAYETIEIVNRGVNMIVDDVSQVPLEVKNTIAGREPVAVGAKLKSVEKLLTYRPNPYQDLSWFLRDCITDYILDGNIFIYYDGTYLYHCPAQFITVTPSESTFIKNYTYNEKVIFNANEIIHIKENSFESIFRGTSRLESARDTLELMHSMRNFQKNFFKNGAVPGLTIESPNTLSQKVKNRLLESWSSIYSPNSGGRRPLILDGGLTLGKIADVDFQELDFNESINNSEKIILKALGIPPILIETGNNANVRPNQRLYYVETVLPIVDKLCKAFERYFGYSVTPNLAGVLAVQPELRDEAAYYSTLVNGGILSPNEARDALGREEMEGHDDLRIPANIAGSAGDPSEGGRPEGEDSEESQSEN